jgi:hypothetical protein
MNAAKLIVVTAVAAVLLALTLTTCAAQSSSTCPSYATWRCSAPVTTRIAPPPISTYQRFIPPPSYSTEMLAAEKCSGRTRPYNYIVWLKAPGRNFWVETRDTTESVIGLWQKSANGRDTIVIAEEFSNLENNWVVRHELIHYLVQSDHYDNRAKNDSLWGIRCKAMWGHLGE